MNGGLVIAPAAAYSRTPLLTLALIFLLGFTTALCAATTTPETNPTVILAHYRQVLSRPQFTEINAPDVNTRFKDWLSLWFMRVGAEFGQFKYASRMPAFESMLMTLLAALSVAAILYTMVRLTRRRERIEFDSPTSDHGPKTFRPPESYDQEIHQAIQSGDWHAAWLATWRQFLSRLENRHLVEADRTRTNREYLAQLRTHTLPVLALGLVNGMVDSYDRVIYGRHPIGETEWNLFQQQINEAALLLHLDARAVALRKPARNP